MVPQQVSFVERSSLSQRVPYQRFHCTAFLLSFTPPPPPPPPLFASLPTFSPPALPPSPHSCCFLCSSSCLLFLSFSASSLSCFSCSVRLLRSNSCLPASKFSFFLSSKVMADFEGVPVTLVTDEEEEEEDEGPSF